MKTTTSSVLLLAFFACAAVSTETNETEQVQEQTINRGGVSIASPVEKVRANSVDLDRLKDLANRGNASAQFLLGWCFLKNDGFPQEFAKSAEAYREVAALEGAVHWQFGLSLSDQVIEKDDAKGVEWIRKAAEQGLVEAMFCLGICYAEGLGVKRDEGMARQWFKKAVDRQNSYANLAKVILAIDFPDETVYEIEQNDPLVKAYISRLRRGAELGDPGLQLLLGWCCYRGIGVAKDGIRAVEWFRQSAAKGFARACFSLGLCYQEGGGVEKDAAKAVEWYRKAAEQGLVEAQLLLGVCYMNGDGVERNAAKAVEWYRKAAEQGNAIAQANLGECYANGEGVEKDGVLAVKWYLKAAEQNNAYAQSSLGFFYMNGEGVQTDAAKAVEWFRKAAEQGDADAQVLLAVCYITGEGVEMDDTKAVELFRKAAEQGNAFALDVLQRYSSNQEEDQPDGEVLP